MSTLTAYNVETSSVERILKEAGVEFDSISDVSTPDLDAVVIEIHPAEIAFAVDALNAVGVATDEDNN